MKHFITILLLSLFTSCCYAQTEPEFEMEPFILNADSTIGTALPCESAYKKAKAAASMYLVGIGKVKAYFYINGTSSPLKIKKTDQIIINTDETSPQQCLSIIKLEQMKSKRRWKTGEAGAFTGATANEDAAVVLKYKKYGENSVVLSLAGYEPGEYCLAITNMMTNTKSAKVYTFCIE